MYKNAIKDCLYNLSLSENLNTSLTYQNRTYYTGLIIGIITALRFSGFDYLATIKIIADSLPDDCIPLEDLNLSIEMLSDIESML